jgi:hypothetical protein
MDKVQNGPKPGTSEFKSYQMILVKKAFLSRAVIFSRISLAIASPLVGDGNVCWSQPSLGHLSHTYSFLSGILNCNFNVAILLAVSTGSVQHFCF